MKSHPVGEELASKLEVTVKDLEILDHIKTSTWKKFLTEMRSDSRGNVREADSNMVTIELKSVRPIAERETEEGRLRVSSFVLRSRKFSSTLTRLLSCSRILGQDPSPSTPR